MIEMMSGYWRLAFWEAFAPAQVCHLTGVLDLPGSVLESFGAQFGRS